MSSKPWTNADTLEQLYWNDGLSLSEVGDELGCSAQTIKNNMDDNDIPTRSVSMSQVDHHGGFYTNNYGHEVVRSQFDGEKDVIPIHRVAAIAWFGIDVVVDNDVHHTNGIPWDTRESNIDLLSKSEHAGQHADDQWGDKPWRDKDTLEKAYESNDRNKVKTGNEFDCSEQTIRVWLRRHGLSE